MTIEQIIKSLSPTQKQELDQNIKEIEERMSATGNIYKDKLHELNVNLRLENVVFLNITIAFIVGPDGKLAGQIINLIKFKNSDEYLDSINKARASGDDWKTLK